MTDITKCANGNCPNALRCYRIQAPDSKYQSYSAFPYHFGINGVVCDYYFPMYSITSSNNTKESK